MGDDEIHGWRYTYVARRERVAANGRREVHMYICIYNAVHV